MAIQAANRLVAGLFCVAGLGAPALADGWFLHEFGEMRAYHGDWLAVCPDEGRAPCRIVQYSEILDGGFFGRGRLAIHPEARLLSLYDLRLDDGAAPTLSARIDGGDRIDFEPRAGDTEARTISQTITAQIPDGVLDALRAGGRVEMAFPGGDVTYGLRGISAALDAIAAEYR